LTLGGGTRTLLVMVLGRDIRPFFVARVFMR
jgi:hypothetical protein